jgi:hypothetical protein
MFKPFCTCYDGPEVQVIRRETVNQFADWQEMPENNAIGVPETDDQQPAVPVTHGGFA